MVKLSIFLYVVWWPLVGLPEAVGDEGQKMQKAATTTTTRYCQHNQLYLSHQRGKKRLQSDNENIGDPPMSTRP